MCFYRALGNVQIASDFRVVTSLEQQIDNLPFPRSHLIEHLFHNSQHLHRCDARSLPVALKPGPLGAWIRVLYCDLCNHAAKSGIRR